MDTRNSTVPKSGGVSGVAGYEKPLDHAWAHPDWPIYVIVSRGDDAAMELFQNVSGFRDAVEARVAGDPAFVKLISNPDITVYLWTPAVSATP